MRITTHENGAIAWTWPLTSAVLAAGAVVGGAGLILRIVGVPGGIVPGFIGLVAAIVAVIGRISSTAELLYTGRELPVLAPPVGNGEPLTRRRRRRSGIAYVSAVLGVLLIVAGSLGLAQDLGALAAVGFGTAIVLAALLAGPVAGFVVTGSHLHIDTAFQRISVPRQLIRGFSFAGLDLRLELAGRDRVRFRVDSELWDLSRGAEYRHNSRCQIRTATRIAAMLAEVPEIPDPTATVSRSRRKTVAILASITGAVALTATGIGAFAAFI